MAAIDPNHMDDDMVITTLAAIATDTIAPKSMLRVIVNSERYTAVIMKDGRVLEVKGPRPSQTYDTPILWAESLQAPLEQVIVSVNEVGTNEVDEEPKDANAALAAKKKPKASKASKPKKEKPHVCDVPKSNEAGPRWMRHVHAMMVEAEVQKTPQIIDHYNELVAYLRSQAGAIWTNTPMASVRYSTGIEITSTTYSIQSIYLYYDQTTPFPRREQICKRIMELYTPLFELIKDKVVPFMKRKHSYHSSLRLIERLKKDLIKSHEQIEIEERDYKARMEHYYKHAKALQSDLDVQEEIVRRHSA